jgi:hypothetical protein
MTAHISFWRISDRMHHLTGVKSLWRANSKTLGFFTDGPFEDHAEKNCDLVAEETGTGNLAGNLLFRITRTSVAITHLCVADDFRGHRVASGLFRRLASDTQLHPGIMVRCHQDYDVNDLWPKLFQNLRSRCETELAERFPLHVVTAWLGNSIDVAQKHYLQVTEAHIAEAAKEPTKMDSPATSPASKTTPKVTISSKKQR